MEDQDKTKEQLLTELNAARRRIAELEAGQKTAGYKQTERLLRGNEQRYYELIELTPIAIFIMTGFKVVYANRAGLDLLGAAQLETVAGRSMLEFVHPEDRAGAQERWEKVVSRGQKAPLREEIFCNLEGAPVHVATVAAPIVYDHKLSALLVANDVTGRKHAEEAYRVLVDNSLQGLSIFQDNQIVFVNSRLAAIFGYSEAELLAMSAAEINQTVVHPDDQALILQRFYDRQAGKTPVAHYESRIVRPDGTIRWLETFAVDIEYRGRPAIQAMAVDITDRKQAEENLRKYERIVSATPDAISLLDRNYVYQIVNEAYLTLNDKTYDQIVGHSVADLLGQEVFASTVKDRLDQALDGKTVHYQAWFGKASGQRFMNVTYSPYFEGEQITGVVASSRDLTDLKLLEEQLRQRQKMEALGHLAGGIAHHFNNMLTAIIGYVSLVMTELPAGHHLVEDLERVQATAQRAAVLTHQLLTFTRKQTTHPEVLDLNDFILSLKVMLRQLIPESIELKTILASALAPIKMDAPQFEQLLIDLVVNAGDAMPDGGRLTIQTANRHITPVASDYHSDLAPGDYVLLTVSDTGLGMTEEVKAHIFEPFFTTKEVGQGVGLGLSSCYGIVKQHKGAITVDSQPGQGTIFKVYLPQFKQAPPLIEPAEIKRFPLGAETILIVEDEADVRQLMAKILDHHGYTILEATNGLEALAIVEDQPEIDLLIADVVMPRLGGKSLAAQLRTRRPDLKVLFVSGHTDEIVRLPEALEESFSFLAKPFIPAELIQKVQDLLENRSADR